MNQQLREAYGHIIFTEESHQYIDTKTGEILPSVTGWIKQFQPEFQEDYWLGVKSKERGITKEELKAEWRWTSKVAVETGSLVHQRIENLLQGKYLKQYIPDYIDKEKLKILFKQVDEYCQSEMLPIISLEQILCDDKLAGMTDKIMQGANGFHIRDFKTGKLKEPYGKHKKPYDMLTDSSLDKYALQLSRYSKFLEDKRFPVEKLEIVWFNENNPTYQIFEVPKIEII